MTIFDPFFDPPKITFLHSPRTRAHPARTLPGEGGEGGVPENRVRKHPPPGGVPGGQKRGPGGAQKRGPRGRGGPGGSPKTGSRTGRKMAGPGGGPGARSPRGPGGPRGFRGSRGGPKTGGRLGVPGETGFLKENPLFPFRTAKSPLFGLKGPKSLDRDLRRFSGPQKSRFSKNPKNPKNAVLGSSTARSESESQRDAERTVREGKGNQQFPRIDALA